MTIKELENRTNMTRANIRFYEGEGLVSPKRLDNGYRDYSEEDARTLEKIKLLRQLQLDIDTIRKVQRGALTLEQALFSQLTRLEGDKSVVERAVQVCRELERSGVEYAALEPQPWLDRLRLGPGPAGPSEIPPAVLPGAEEPEEEVHWACWHPWRRLLARELDMAVYGTLFALLWVLAARDWSAIRAGGLAGWVKGAVLLAFALAAEPLWLHYWGWTPGKWVLGLKLRNEAGGKLTLAQGLRRSLAVLRDGCGWGIPFWSLWKAWQCRKLGLKGRDCRWDEEEDYRYTKQARRFAPQLYAGICVLCAGLLYAGFLHTRLPVARGPLTVEDFCRNYNHYLAQLVDRDHNRLPGLDGEGRWVEREGGVVEGSFVNEGYARWDQPEFTLEHGRVTAVRLHMESDEETVPDMGTRQLLVLLAMSGSLDGLTAFNFDLRGWVEACRKPMARWEDLDFAYRGLHVAMEAEQQGYEPWDAMMLWGSHDGAGRCEKTIVISLLQ